MSEFETTSAKPVALAGSIDGMTRTRLSRREMARSVAALGLATSAGAASTTSSPMAQTVFDADGSSQEVSLQLSISSPPVTADVIHRGMAPISLSEVQRRRTSRALRADSSSTSRQVDPLVSHPENFYVYRYTLVPDSVLDIFKTQKLAEFSNLNMQYKFVYFLRVWRAWNQGNHAMERGLYGQATAFYNDCLRAIPGFLKFRNPASDAGSSSLDYPIFDVEDHFATDFAAWLALFAERRALTDLIDLYEYDWERPREHWTEPYQDSAFWTDSSDTIVQDARWKELVEVPVVALGMVHVPMALSEAYRFQRQFDLAQFYCEEIQAKSEGSPDSTEEPWQFLNTKIEVPFIRILDAQALTEKAEVLYRSGETENAKEALNTLLTQLESEGNYVKVAKAGRDALNDQVISVLRTGQSAALGTERSRLLQEISLRLPIAGIQFKGSSAVEPLRSPAPYERYLEFGGAVGADTNPLVYSLVLDALGRLQQIEGGFNYLGYREDFIPPWTFRFLLDRARYFTQQARNAQGQYVTFLANAEREEFQELVAGQTVSLEKANVQVETARVRQSTLDIAAAQQGQEMATLVASNAEERLNNYQEFEDDANYWTDKAIDGAVVSSIGASVTGAASGALAGGQAGGYVGAIIGGIIGGLGSGAQAGGQAYAQYAQLQIGAAQRELEEAGLELAIAESAKAVAVASSQVAVAQAALVVTSLQRSAALLRHDAAVECLAFLRTRTLNADMWHRLANVIRRIGDTYQRYAIEIAFLAEQAYEYEADTPLNFIRFDYASDEASKLLAADLLAVDLDSLEQYQIVSQRERQQQAQYVLSLARDLPGALIQLRETGSTTFTLSLEQLERRFPSLVNLRIGAVDVLPVALMDPTRFALELTYMGASQVRLRSLFGLSNTDLVPGGSWMPGLDAGWPVRIRMPGPQTAVMTGLSRSDRQAIFPFQAESQLQAFEHLGAASSWRVDMSMRENRVVPGTLTDLLMTINLTGYHDPQLLKERESQGVRLPAMAQWLSTRLIFPDTFFKFNESGVATWSVSSELLTLSERPGALRNLAVILVPAPNPPQFGRLMSSGMVEFRVTDAGEVKLLSPVPRVTFLQDGLNLTATVELPGFENVSTAWNFGDGAGFQAGATLTHAYARPGAYDLGLRVSTDDHRLYDYQARIVVSKKQSVTPPLTAFPLLSVVPSNDKMKVKVEMAPGAKEGAVTTAWKLGDEAVTAPTYEFTVIPGDHRLTYLAMRDLSSHLYSGQRYLTDKVFAINGLRISTDRTFDRRGKETTDPTKENPLRTALVDDGAISPVDKWTLELRVADNPFLRSVGTTDDEHVDLSEIADVVLGLEYDVMQ